MARLYYVFIISMIIFGCVKPEGDIIPDNTEPSVVTPQPNDTTKNTIPKVIIPYPEILNPTDKKRIIREDKATIWYGYRVVDTTVYQYNEKGIVEKEFFTTKTGASPSNQYSIKTFTVSAENVGNPNLPFVYEIIQYPQRGVFIYYYGDENGRVNKKVIMGSRTEYYTYDSNGRLEIKISQINDFHSDSTKYVYYSKSETGLENDYYSELQYTRTRENGVWKVGLIEQNDYHISNFVKNDLSVHYPFNYGKKTDYVIEKIHRRVPDNFNRSYSFEFNDDGKIEKTEYLYRENSFWTKYYYD